MNITKSSMLTVAALLLGILCFWISKKGIETPVRLSWEDTNQIFGYNVKEKIPRGRYSVLPEKCARDLCTRSGIPFSSNYRYAVFIGANHVDFQEPIPVIKGYSEGPYLFILPKTIKIISPPPLDFRKCKSPSANPVPFGEESRDQNPESK